MGTQAALKLRWVWYGVGKDNRDALGQGAPHAVTGLAGCAFCTSRRLSQKTQRCAVWSANKVQALVACHECCLSDASTQAFRRLQRDSRDRL